MKLSDKQASSKAILPILDRIGLGTVQFGIDYGITNAKGKVSKAEVNKITETASKIGISVFDTACEYGNSEAVLGQALPKGNDLKIVTKTPASKNLKIEYEFCENVKLKFEESLINLGVDKTYGLLTHHAADILKPGGDQLVETLNDIQMKDKTDKIGVSVYNAEEIDGVLELFLPDIIQVPINILDQRLLKSGKLKKLKNLGVEIHARSLFLQGTLLINTDKLPAFFSPVQHRFQEVEKMAENLGLSQLELCLLFGLSIDEIDLLVIGVTSLEELLDIQTSYSNLTKRKLESVTHLSIDEEKYINPALWPIN